MAFETMGLIFVTLLTVLNKCNVIKVDEPDTPLIPSRH